MFELPQISLSLSKPAIHVVMEIVSSWKQNNPKPADILASSLLDDVFPAHGIFKFLLSTCIFITDKAFQTSF